MRHLGGRGIGGNSCQQLEHGWQTQWQQRRRQQRGSGRQQRRARRGAAKRRSGLRIHWLAAIESPIQLHDPEITPKWPGSATPCPTTHINCGACVGPRRAVRCVHSMMQCMMCIA